METRASPFIVGLFTILLLAGVAVVVFWLGRYGEAAGREEYRIVFSDDVTGLNRGSSVLFNGIRVGDVVDLSISPEDPSKVIARVTVDSSVPVREDTRAQLQFQGITGIGFVQLKAGSAESAPIHETWSEPGQSPIIHAERSTFQDLMEGAQTLMTKLDSVAQRVETLVATNEAAVTTTIRNVETFTAALADNSDQVAGFLADAGAAARSFSSVGERVESLTDNIERLVIAVDPEAVARVVANVDSFSQNLEGTSERLDGMIGRVDTLIADNEASVATSVRNFETFTTALAENSETIETFMTEASAAARRLNDVGERVETLVAAVDPETVTRAVGNLDSFTASLAGRSEAVERFVDDAGAVAAQLRETTGQLGGVVERVDTLIASNETSLTTSIRNFETFTTALSENSGAIETFMADASSAANRLNEVGVRMETLADNLNTVVAAVEPDEVRAIMADVRSFTGALGSNADRISSFVNTAAGAAESLDSLAGQLEAVVAAVDPQMVSQSVANVESFTSSLAGKSEDVERFIDDAGAVAAQLRQSSERLDALLVRVDGMIGEEGAGSFLADISAAARSFRELTEGLDARFEAITADIQRLGGGGLREFQSFMSEGRRTLSNLDRVIGNLESNPSGFLFGGTRVPEYNPDRRF